MMYIAKPELPAIGWRRASASIYRLFLNKWYVDELYDMIFVRPYRAMARGLWHVGDESIIDGIPRSGAALARGSARAGWCGCRADRSPNTPSSC